MSIRSFVFYVAIQSIANVNAESEQEICHQSYMYIHVCTYLKVCTSSNVEIAPSMIKSDSVLQPE